MFKIAYYDNMDSISVGKGKEIPHENKAELMHELCWWILDWVDSHDAFLTIKTKERKSFRTLRHGPYWIWFRKQPAKEIYKYYPPYLQNRIDELERISKVVFRYERGDITPAIKADAVIVTLSAETAFDMIDYGLKRIIILDQHHKLHHNGIMRYGHIIYNKRWIPISSKWTEFKIKDEVEFIDSPSEITGILDKRLKEKFNRETGPIDINDCGCMGDNFDLA